MNNKPLLTRYSLPGQLVFLAALVLVSLFIFILAAGIFTIIFFGTDTLFSAASSVNFSNPEQTAALKLLQIFQHIGMFIVPPFVFAFLISDEPGKYLYLDKPASFSSVASACLVTIAALPLINWMVQVNEMMSMPGFLSGIEKWMKDTEAVAEEITKAFLKMDSTADLAVNMFMIAILPSIGEELLFRGAVQQLFTKWTRNAHWGIIISASIFSALHLQFYGFFPRMALGVLFGYILLWSGSIWLPVIAHFINNGSAVMFSYMSDKGIVNFDADNLGTGEHEIIILIASALITTVLLYLIYKKEKHSERFTDNPY